MRCFKACFMCTPPSVNPGRAPPLAIATASKDNRDGHSETLEMLPCKYSERELGGKPIKPTPESKEMMVEEEEKRCTGQKKKVTFDLPTIYKAPKGVIVTANLVLENIEKHHKEETLLSEWQSMCIYSNASDVASSARTRIRHQNSAEKAEECENLSETEFQDEGPLMMQDESSESLFSLSIDSRKQAYGAEVDDEKDVTSSHHSELDAAGSIPSSASDRSSSNVDLNRASIRIENLLPLRSVKPRSMLPYDDKENIGAGIEPGNGKLESTTSSQHNGNKKQNTGDHQQVAVEAILSSWLVIQSQYETTATSPPSCCLSGDGPIFGALATEQKKVQCSSGSNSRRQSSRKMPLLGTVGSYWIHTGRIIIN